MGLRGGILSFLVLLLGASIASAFLGGCSNNECYENHSALPLAYFYNSSTKQQVSLNGVEIYGIGAPGDSILYRRQNLQEAYLPFRIWQDTTRYVFQYDGLLPDSLAEIYPALVPRDTITFCYRPKEWFVSPACGAMYFFDMKSVDHTSFLIDSIAFNEVITNENKVNIKIFLKEELAE